jgi:hypothetical protein
MTSSKTEKCALGDVIRGLGGGRRLGKKKAPENEAADAAANHFVVFEN